MGLLLGLIGGALSMVMALILGVLGIIGWLVKSIAYTIALKKMAYGNVWCAWVPILRDIAILDCLGKTQSHSVITIAGIDISLDKMKYIMIGYVILDIVFSNMSKWLSAIAMLVRILILVIEYTTVFSYIENKKTEDKQLVGCLAGVFPIIAIIKFYMYSNISMDNQ